jgi:transcriptional regulator with XRE-family HTH domain
MSGIEFQNLGAKLRHARKVKKLRLKDVALEVGCSESLLSKIECDKTTGSVRAN